MIEHNILPLHERAEYRSRSQHNPNRFGLPAIFGDGITRSSR